MELPIHEEAEAALTILFACAMKSTEAVSDQQIEQLSKAVVLCTKFRGHDLNTLTAKAIDLQARYELKDVLDQCTRLIADDFRETLFAMVSEIVLLDGQINDEKTKIMALLAISLGVSMERMKMILATYLIRNKWNIQA